MNIKKRIIINMIRDFEKELGRKYTRKQKLFIESVIRKNPTHEWYVFDGKLLHRERDEV